VGLLDALHPGAPRQAAERASADVVPLAAMAAATAAAEQRLRGLQAGAPGSGLVGAGAEAATAAPASAVDPGLLPALQAALRCAQRTGCAFSRGSSLQAVPCSSLPFCHGATVRQAAA
jgi:hypothetical protein